MPRSFGCTMIKSFTYRGIPEKWVNDYSFNGTPPADSSDWLAFATALAAVEGAFFTGNYGCEIIGAYGYLGDSTISAATVDFTDGGTVAGITPSGDALDSPGTTIAPPQACALLRFPTGQRSSLGKTTYTFKYYHATVTLAGSSGGSTAWISPETSAPLLAKFTNGTLPGGAVLCTPSGHDVIGAQTRPYVTTHQLLRRGKRPSRG
jgi:hypothetical protein